MSEGLLSSLSQSELESLSAFKAALGPVAFDDHTLARFLKARKFQVPKAVEMFQKYVAWRQEYDMAHIFEYQFPEAQQVKQYYPHGFHKTDKAGRPIYIEMPGQLLLSQLLEVTTEERILRYFVREYERIVVERLPACSYAAGHRVEQMLTILDLNGAGLWMMSRQVYHFVTMASGVAQDYYPELLGKMYIVNAPFLFSTIWSMVKPLIDEKTRNKITILGGSFQSQLLEEVEASNLPKFLGGECECEGGCLLRAPGPWDSEVPQPLLSTEEHKDEDDPAFDDLRSAIQVSLKLSSEKPPVGRFGDNAITPMNTMTEDDGETH